MEWNEVKTHWQAHRGEVCRRWPQLSDRQLDRIDGDRQRLAECIQDVYLLDAQEAERQIAAWLRGHEVEVDAAHPHSEPGVSEDDAVRGQGGNILPAEGGCHGGYMDDEEQSELSESARAGRTYRPDGTPPGR
jgi:uncharacterized protein YjbJ (UPF0337 family)